MMKIHEVNQNDVQVHDNRIKRRNLDHFVNYSNVLIEQPERKKDESDYFRVFFS